MFEKGLFVMDGATGTQLQKAGMPAGACSEKWVLEHTETLIALQRDYVSAGSAMVYAPTFGANRVNLKKHGVSESVESVCGALVELSREAVGKSALVIGDISSTGLLLEPYGDCEEDELLEVFTEQAKALENAGVDLFGIETQMYLDEARVAAKAVRSVSDKPLIVSFACGPTGRTIWGEDLRDILSEMEQFELSAFGMNCVGDLELVETLLRSLRERTDLPLIAKPNAGMPALRDGRQCYDLSPETMGQFARRYIAAGARLIGGCCGTDAGHIAAIKKAVSEREG